MLLLISFQLRGRADNVCFVCNVLILLVAEPTAWYNTTLGYYSTLVSFAHRTRNQDA